jgi:hypothetical protein
LDGHLHHAPALLLLPVVQMSVTTSGVTRCCRCRCLQEDDEIVTLQVGKTVWDQAPRQMRVELWMSSLQRRGVGVAAAAKYEDMLLTVRVLHVARACAFLQSGCGGWCAGRCQGPGSSDN